MAMDLGQKGGKPGRATPSMNVTPLVDVVLVLLIIFMVITPLLAKQFWIHLPNKVEKDQPQDASDKDKPIVVTLTKDGALKINRDVIPKAAFATKLHRVLAGSGQRTIFLTRRTMQNSAPQPRRSTWRAAAARPRSRC